MKKYIVSSVLFFAVLVSPALAQAQTTGLTSTQIGAIIGLLQAFGADQATINNVEVALNGGTPTASGQFCYNFNSDLTFGSSGASVSALNQALSFTKLTLNDNVDNSVFNENTAADVVQFQAMYGIRQTGYVGPLTRAKLNSLYGCNTNTNSDILSFSAMPQSGTAPLSVTFNLGLSGQEDTSNYAIDFGDGAAISSFAPNCGGKGGSYAGCSLDQSAQHTYASAGTYTAELVYAGNVVSNRTNLTITVTSGTTTTAQTNASAPTLSYITPTSATVGSTVYVHGSNFNSSTYVAFDGDFGKVIYPDNAPANGTGIFSFTIPATNVGVHTIQVNEKGATFPSSNSVTLTVVAPPTISYINPTSARIGSTVWVYGSNFNSSTYVAFDGDFGQVVYPDNAPASGTGVFSFTVPSNAGIGNHSIQINEK